MQKKHTPVKLFVAAFAVLILFTMLQNWLQQKATLLEVPNNKGVSFMETAGNWLICVFQDGKTCVWNWSDPAARASEFQAVSERTIVLNEEQIVSVSSTGKKVMTLYSLPDGKKQKELSVGWEDQDVSPCLSPDKKTAALVRSNPIDSAGDIWYEFSTLDIDKELLGQPLSLSIRDSSEEIIDFALDCRRILYFCGSREDNGRIAALNLENGSIAWDRTYDDMREFCNLLVSPDDRHLLAGNRDGILYKIDAADGTVIKKIILLESGEKREVTNDLSVLNLAFSPDGQFYVATINPMAYILQVDSDTIIQKFSPADKLVSKIAFSPDNQQVATSDIRASYPIKIWKLRGTGQ